MDETGHSKDQRSKFNGMAGLITKEESWLVYEREWGKILSHFKIPYIHMSERSKMFKGWSDEKKKDLSRCVWEIIKNIEALPLGSIIPMDDYRPIEDRIRKYIPDPYFMAMMNCMAFATGFLRKSGPFKSTTDMRVALVFSDQVEFRPEALRMFEGVKKHWADQTKVDLIDSPIFRDMRKVTPLQAADIIAYEIYKEYDRLYYKRPRKSRHGYERIEEILESFAAPFIGRIDPVLYHNEYTLNAIVSNLEAEERTAEYWRKKKASKTKPD
jgi:hypothetical protein